MSIETYYEEIPEDSVLHLLIGEASRFGRIMRIKRWIGVYYPHVIVVVLSLFAVFYITMSGSIINSELFGIRFGVLVNFAMIFLFIIFVGFLPASSFILQTRLGRSLGALKISIIDPDNGGRGNKYEQDHLVKRIGVIPKEHQFYQQVIRMLDEKGQLRLETGKDSIFKEVHDWKKHVNDERYKKYIKEARDNGKRLTVITEKEKTIAVELSPLQLLGNIEKSDFNLFVIDFTDSLEYRGKRLPGIPLLAEGKTLEEILPGKNTLFSTNGMSFGNIPINAIEVIPVAHVNDMPIMILGSTKSRNLSLAHCGYHVYEMPTEGIINNFKNLIQLFIAKRLQTRIEQLENEKKIMAEDIKSLLRDRLGWAKMQMIIHRLMQTVPQPKLWLILLGGIVIGLFLYPMASQWLDWLINWLTQLFGGAKTGK